MSKKNTNRQAIRLIAIKHQLKALVSQLEAIKKLDCEHREGIDLGADPEIVNILNYSERLASRAETIVKKVDASDSDGVALLLVRMKQDVAYLNEHASYFERHAHARAEEHLQEVVHVKAGALSSESNAFDGDNSSCVQAGLSCFRAESNQYRTFEMQVLALAYLALEVAYFSADEVGINRRLSRRLEGDFLNALTKP